MATEKKKCDSEMRKYRCARGHEFEVLSTRPQPKQCHCGNRELTEVKNCDCGGDCECGKDKKKDKKGGGHSTFEFDHDCDGFCGGCGKK